MSYWKSPAILAIASVSGGFFLTLFSGLYAVKPFILDAEIIYFGFPLPWLEAGRSTWKSQVDWRYLFLWDGLIVDFIIYGLLVATSLGLYFRSWLMKRKP